MSGACLFCEIVAGKRPAHVVLDADAVLAFLDHRPLFPGHVLVVPRTHRGTLADLPAADVAAFFLDVRLLAQAVETSMEAEGTFVAMNNRVSQSVPHLHVHVVPRSRGDGLRGFFWPRRPYDGPRHMEETAARIRDATTRLRETGGGEG